MNAIEIRGLRKRFRKRLRSSVVALDGIDLDVPEGSIYGFLGPNGSGKTTTIRCLLGLVRPDDGTCRVLGADPGELASVVGDVGAIVETPTFFGGFSGRRNLEILGKAAGLPRRAVDETLERVGLAMRADDRFRTYSLGMKQRLGLAAVLMKDPRLLILDEPANGLDPAGFKEIRELLRSLADEGRTVFLSSHILGEVQMVCDSVAILARGRCIVHGPVDDVISASGTGAFIVRAPKVRDARRILNGAGLTAVYRGDRSLHVTAEDPAVITRTLAEAGVYLTELRPEEVSLEAVFLELTSDG